MSEYVAFPLDLLPRTLARFTTETALALGCDPAFVALPALCATAAAIGTTRTVALKESWREPAVLWGAVVARSGTLKSPALDAALAPLRESQAAALREHAAALEAHAAALLRYERDVAVWRKSKGASEPPTKPKAPAAQRLVTADVTIEALAPILSENPRGVLLARDELAGWLGSFGQYKAGRGADAQAWLELWRAGTLIVDRKSVEPRTMYVARAAAGVTGTVQPGILAGALTAEHFASGLAARLLLVNPPERPKRWSERVPERAAVAEYGYMLRELGALEHEAGEHGPEPVALPLAPEAREPWQIWYDRHAARIADAADDTEAAALAKMEAYAARFALIFALAENAGVAEVSRDALERGCALADWFAAETLRVYGLLAEPDDARELRELVEWIGRQGGRVTARDLTRGPQRYRGDVAAAESALAGLVQAGLGAWETARTGATGGQPTRRFRLHDDGGGDGTPDNCGANRGSVAVAIDKSGENAPEWGAV